MSSQTATSQDILQPDPVVHTITGSDGRDYHFVQDKLTFFEKQQVLSLVARAIDQALAEGLDIAQIIKLFELGDNLDDAIDKFRLGQITAADLPDPVSLIRALLRIVGDMPEVLESLYMIALSVKPADQPHTLSVIMPGMDDETGFAIFDTFMEQNAEALKGFTMRWLEQLKAAGASLQKPKRRSARSRTSSG
jgi:hypothetical protein